MKTILESSASAYSVALRRHNDSTGDVFGLVKELREATFRLADVICMMSESEQNAVFGYDLSGLGSGSVLREKIQILLSPPANIVFLRDADTFFDSFVKQLKYYAEGRYSEKLCQCVFNMAKKQKAAMAGGKEATEYYKLAVRKTTEHLILFHLFDAREEETLLGFEIKLPLDSAKRIEDIKERFFHCLYFRIPWTDIENREVYFQNFAEAIHNSIRCMPCSC